MAKQIKILAPDSGALTDKLVREMEARGYTLDNVDTSGAYDQTAREALSEARRASRGNTRREIWRAVRAFLSALAWLAIPLVLLYITT